MYCPLNTEEPSHRFGLKHGEIAGGPKKVFRNGLWYSGNGEYLGDGDTGLDDIVRIANELQPGEAFVILTEDDARELDWSWDTDGRLTQEQLNTAPALVMLPGAIHVVRGGEYPKLDYWASGGYVELLKETGIPVHQLWGPTSLIL
ncbi:MAG: hypothetical protein Q8P30_02910 [Candidatus Uhrbacteria bacterium]|nr:hypothetical protein [Candidatus Uhrbacteria bacterium]